jgi:hypothetical protein
VTSLAVVMIVAGAQWAEAQAPRPLGGPGDTLERAVAAAEEAARTARMRVSVSAVGFQVAPNSAAAQDLQAAAGAGGGVYVPASEVGQLVGALRRAVEGSGEDVPVDGPRGKVALLTAPVLRGAAENGERLTAALRAAAAAAGLGVAPAAAVAAEVQGVNLRFPQPLPRLVEWGRKLGVDYIVYPRVLSVGRPFNSVDENERVMAILINIADVKAGRMVHTQQVGATYIDDQTLAESLAPAEVVATAAAKLLEGFLARLPGAAPPPGE